VRARAVGSGGNGRSVRVEGARAYTVDRGVYGRQGAGLELQLGASASSSTTRGGHFGRQFGRDACDWELELGRPGDAGVGIRKFVMCGMRRGASRVEI
jgi:hypothetical protein